MSKKYYFKTEASETKGIPLSDLLEVAGYKEILNLTNPDLAVLLISKDPVLRAIHARAPKKFTHLKCVGPLSDEMLARVVKTDGRRHSKNSRKYVYQGKTASFNTVRERKQQALHVAGMLQKIDPRLQSLDRIEPWHIAVIYVWGAARDLSAQAFNSLGVFFRDTVRVLGHTPEDFLPARNRVIRERLGVTKRYVPGKTNRGFQPSGITPEKMIEDFACVDPRMGVQLQVLWKGAMRIREVVTFNPHSDYNPDTGRIHVRRGTKGGRRRVADRIADPVGFRNAVEALVPYVNAGTGSTIPDGLTRHQWLKKMYAVAKKLDYTRRQNGYTFHSLRHAGLQDVFRAETGTEPPVAGGGRIAKSVDLSGRRRVSEVAGHGRDSASNPYLGPSPYRHEDASTANGAMRPIGEMRRQLRGPYVRKNCRHRAR